MKPKAWFKPSTGTSNAGNESHTGQTKYAIPETATTNLGKAWQFYGAPPSHTWSGPHRRRCWAAARADRATACN